jgi:ribose 5-phosphate isomerase RpiB
MTGNDRNHVDPAPAGKWWICQEHPHPLVQSAVQVLHREGLPLEDMPPAPEKAACAWAKAVGKCVARGDCCGGVVFCRDPGLICCVANKLPGLRAVAANSTADAERAASTVGANLVVVAMPGRTFFEIRQILRILCRANAPQCPPGVATTLKELDGHAHR